MVEALMSVPFFVIIFIMAIFLGKLYREKLRTMRESKQCAWAAAMANCEGGCGQASIEGLGDANLDQGAEANPSAGHPQVDDWLMGRPFKQARFKVDGSATASTAMNAGGFSANVTTTNVVVCNEKPEDGKWRSIFLYTYHKLTPW